MSKLSKVTAWATGIVAVFNVPPAVYGCYKWLSDDMDIDLAQGVSNAYQAMYGWLFETRSIPVWLLLLAFVALAYAWVCILRLYIAKALNARSESQPEHAPKVDVAERRMNDALTLLDGYRSRVFFGANWKWEWTCFPPRVKNLTPYCTTCASKLELRGTGEKTCQLICTSDICVDRVVNSFSGYDTADVLKVAERDLTREGVEILDRVDLL